MAVRSFFSLDRTKVRAFVRSDLVADGFDKTVYTSRAEKQPTVRAFGFSCEVLKPRVVGANIQGKPKSVFFNLEEGIHFVLAGHLATKDIRAFNRCETFVNGKPVRQFVWFGHAYGKQPSNYWAKRIGYLVNNVFRSFEGPFLVLNAGRQIKVVYFGLWRLLHSDVMANPKRLLVIENQAGIRHRCAGQHGQRKSQSLHLQSPILRNSRHHRARLRGCQHPRPAGTSAFRAGLGHTARGRGRPHLSAPFTSLLDCGRHHAGVARIFPAVRGGAS